MRGFGRWRVLHGHPQTLAIWHKVAPTLAQHFTVVAADLRGYGDSSKPEGGPDHAAYAKRSMAQDQVSLMQQLGFDRSRLALHIQRCWPVLSEVGQMVGK